MDKCKKQNKLVPRKKYGNVPVAVDGIRFASKAEARRYGELKLLQRAGEISSLQTQPGFCLAGGVKYRADFAYFERNKWVVEDVKGYETQVFKIKAKLFRAAYPKQELRVVKA